jgi:hypothetical protein
LIFNRGLCLSPRRACIKTGIRQTGLFPDNICLGNIADKLFLRVVLTHI